MIYKAFNVNGILNTTQYDDGLVSLVEVPVRLKSFIINTSAMEGNIVEGWIGNKKLVEIYDYCLDTQEETAGATAPLSQNKISIIPLDIDIPPGQLFRIAINSGGVASNIFGAYAYEEIS